MDPIGQCLYDTTKASPSPTKTCWLLCTQNSGTASLRTQVLAWGCSKPFPFNWVLKCVLKCVTHMTPWNFGSLWNLCVEVFGTSALQKVGAHFIPICKPPLCNMRSSPSGLLSIFVSQLHCEPPVQTLTTILVSFQL